jgi:hypothetical protein
MPVVPLIRSFVRNLFLPRSTESDLDQEIQSHLEMLADEHMQAGMTPEEARRAARIELGGTDRVKEQVREVRSAIGYILFSRIAATGFGDFAGVPALLLSSY